MDRLRPFAGDDVGRSSTRVPSSRRRSTSLRASMMRTAGRPALRQWSVEHMSATTARPWPRLGSSPRITPRGGDRHEVGRSTVCLGASLLYAGRLTDAARPPPACGRPLCRSLGRARPLLFVSTGACWPRPGSRACSAFAVHLGPSLRAGSFELRGRSIVRRWDHCVLGPAGCAVSRLADAGRLAAAEAAVAALSDWAGRMNATLWKTMATGWQGKLLIARGRAAAGIELISQTLEACERSGWRLPTSSSSATSPRA